MHVLITGGSGQIGTALRESGPPGMELRTPSSEELDIRSADSVAEAFAARPPDLAINAAAYTAVERAEEDRELAMDVNGTGARNMAAACAASGCPLIHLSTDYVFDGNKEGPYANDDPPSPLNVYGHSKLEGERAVSETLKNHLILRVSWVFSATGSNFVKTMMHLAERQEVRVVNDQHGTPCPASSIAAAIWRITHHWTASSPVGTYHFASAPATTWYEFAREVFAAMREADPGASTPRVVPITTAEHPTLAARPRNSLLDSTSLRTDFGISTPDWRTALRSVIGRLLPG